MPEFLVPIVEWLSPLWENPSSFFNFDFLPKYWFYFRQGILYTLLLSVVSVLLAVIPALLLALMRLSKNKFLRGLSGAYIAVFRSTPMLVQLSLVYFGLFSAIQLPNVTLFGFLKLSTFIPCVTALALNSSAYVAEIFRAGILAVDAGQTEASRSLGLSSWQTMRLVVLPQAIKNILPTLANEVVTMVKESSICSTIGMMDLMWGAKNVAATTFISVGPYMVAALIYFCINYPAGKAIEAIERRMRRGDK
jgi:polar amino acid transport system permease protein